MFLDIISHEFEKTSNTIGGGSSFELSFRPLRPGKTKITLDLKRPWETDAINTKEYEIEIL
jgi:predicted secreted protein